MCCICSSAKSWKRRNTTMRSAVFSASSPEIFELPGSMKPLSGIDGEEHAALEAVALREDARQGRQRFLRPVFVIAGDQHDVLAGARALDTLVDDQVRVGLGSQRAAEDENGAYESSDVPGHSSHILNSQLPNSNSQNEHGSQPAPFGNWELGVGIDVARRQNVNRMAPCMMRGSRADVALPNAAFTCSPAGLNWAVVLMPDQFTVLNRL